MGVLVWLANDLPLALTIPLGAGIYVLGILAVKVISRDDLAELGGMMSRRRAAPTPAHDGAG